MAAKEKLFQLIEKDDLDGLNELLEDEFDLSIRNKDGKRALELSALLGRKNIIELLIQKEDNINVANSSGYTPVHLCCMWGHIDCLKVLIRAGADYNMKTRHEETVKQLSSRYGQTQCVSYLECTEKRADLKDLITSARETLSDSERITGKWNKDDKSKVTSLCNEKTEWLDKNLEANESEIIEQIEDFNERYQTHLSKLDTRQD